MPIAFLAALAGSFVIHAAALFLPDVDLSTAPELPAITAEIQLPPRPVAVKESRKAAEPPARHHSEHHRTRLARSVAAAAPPLPGVALPEPELAHQADESRPPEQPEPEKTEPEKTEVVQPEPAAVAAGTAEPQLPSRGYIRFSVFKGGQGLLVGRSQHSWEFAEGRYRLFSITETIGLAALLKPVRIELESRGNLIAGGLQPERFTTRRNGAETNENADFDWQAHQVTLNRDGSRRGVADGAQDLLSFHYQFAYLANPAEGTDMGVATGKKFENYRFQAMGEEEVETQAGRFRTLHVQVRTDSTTELWLALDRRLIPVKIRYTDRKGESFEQVATELGI